MYFNSKSHCASTWDRDYSYPNILKHKCYCVTILDNINISVK
jgi:hypothetical protein